MKYYKYKYYLNAKHSFDYKDENIHSHTFAITLHLYISNDEFLSFDNVDTFAEQYFERYSGKYLNDIPEFVHELPTIENIGDHFYESLKILFRERGLELMQLEIAETPVRSYLISDRILLRNKNIQELTSR